MGATYHGGLRNLQTDRSESGRKFAHLAEVEHPLPGVLKKGKLSSIHSLYGRERKNTRAPKKNYKVPAVVYVSLHCWQCVFAQGCRLLVILSAFYMAA